MAEILSSNPYFKVKSIKTFVDPESLMFGERKYRKVFDESEAKYVYPEVALFNKKFDEEEWTAKAQFLIFNNTTNEKIGDYTKDYLVSKETNIVNVNEGWGNESGTFWKKGTYRFEFIINGINVGNTYIYIVNYGVWSNEKNPYFNLVSMKLYESGKEDPKKGERTYVKQFLADNTKYINIEISLENLLKNEDHNPVEFQFNIYTKSGFRKAYIEYFYYISDKRLFLDFSNGYGSTTGSYFTKDEYTFEVIFMGKLFAIVPFSVGDELVLFEGETQHLGTENYNNESIVAPVSSEQTFESASQALNELIGLEKVKKEISELSTYLKFVAYRKEQGFDEKTGVNLNLVFTGNPGTGKTTVANLLGNIYKSLGLLSKGNVIEIGRPDLVGEYIGQTAPKVKKAIEMARGGILFVDEAYALTDRGSSDNDFGKEVIEVLLKEMSDGNGDIAFVFAGYTNEMTEFVNKNPGLKSRIGQIIHFDDYSPEELLKIADYAAKKKHITLDVSAWQMVQKYLSDVYRVRDKSFGNARLVNGIMEEAKQNMALRLMSKGDLQLRNKEELTLVIGEDVQKFFEESKRKVINFPVDEPKLNIALGELRNMVGLHNIKKEIEEIVKLVKYYNDIGKDVKKSLSLHMVFTGSPGTGKTTVARIVIEIFKSLGILERGQMVECDRQDLISGYLGQTAIKTEELINKAIGGGLFIDEAYSLSQGGENDFGKEAIETLLKRMEDDRGRFMVIAAGYTDEMRRFLESNPGLISRFDKTLHFEDFSADELFSIGEKMFAIEQLFLNEKAAIFFKNLIVQLLEKKNRFFGNARTIRKIAEQTVKKQNLRMADIPNAERSFDKIKEIILSDLENFSIEEGQTRKSTIGFNK